MKRILAGLFFCALLLYNGCARGESARSAILIEADTVVCALGFRAPFAVVDALCDMCEDSVAIGDCRNVGQIYHAMTAGYYAARSI